MTLEELIKMLDYNMLMKVIFEVYGHIVEVLKYRDEMLEESSHKFLDMKVESIKPILYSGTKALQVNLKN